MTLHVIHLKHRRDRLAQVLSELENEGINDYVFWEGFHDSEKPVRGIAKAHQQIVRWAMESGLPEVLIAEDDVKFSGKDAFTHYLNNEPEDYDLYLGGISYGKLKLDNSVDDFAGTHFYKIRRRFYQTFLSLSGEKDIDRALAGKGKFIVCNPMIAIQSDGFSDNTLQFRLNSLHFKKRKLWSGDTGR